MRPAGRLLSLLIVPALLAVTACSHVPWTGRYMSGPIKRSQASEERAVHALDAFFDATSDLIGLAAAGTHDDCLSAYWAEGPMTPQRQQQIDDDKVCAFVVDRFDKAAFDIAGYGQAPSGKYPWLGEVFEYVVRTDTVVSKEEKMARIDRYVIDRFEALLAQHDSFVIRQVAADYYYIRGTCCRDVTVFDDWYKARFARVSSN